MLRRRMSIAAVLTTLLCACAGPGSESTPRQPDGQASAPAAPTGDTSHAEPTRAPSNVTAVAHRGAFTAGISENGLPALENADRLSAEMVEFDVRPTLDHQLLVLHDGGLARTTDCQGQVWGRTLADIQEHCRLDDGSTVPAVEEYVDFARERRLPLMIELKDGPGWTADILHDLRAILSPVEDFNGSVFLSFDDRLLALAHNAVPELPGIWIVPRRLSASDAAQDVPVDGFLVDGELTTQAWVDGARRRDKLVYSRVIDTVRGWRRCTVIGLHGVLTNRLAAYLRWRDRAGQ